MALVNDSNTYGPIRNGERYSVCAVRMTGQHFILVRGHDGVTVHVSGDEVERLKHWLEFSRDESEFARDLVACGAVYKAIDMLFIRPALVL